MVRPPCCDKLNVKRGIWTAEEDAKILAYVAKHGAGNWTSVPKKAGLRRCGKSCRLRWTNYLRPDLKHESFTPQEEEMIVRLHAAIGSRWSIIAQQLPGRTDNDVKNYWNTKLRKKLAEMGIDPVTHKPFSQILADYGNIGGIHKSGTRIGHGSLNRDMKNAFMPIKPEPYQIPVPLPPLPHHQGFSNTHLNHLMVSHKVEPMHDSIFLNNNSNNNSMDLLAQLQAMVEASNWANNHHHHETIIPPSHQIFNIEGSLSSSASSSSSSTCSTAGVQEKSSSPITFSWQDFLLEDVCLSGDHQAQGGQEFPLKDFTNETQKVTLRSTQINNETTTTTTTQIKYSGVASYDFPPSSSSMDSSFVEAMIDRENEMFLEFPDLLEEPFYN